MQQLVEWAFRFKLRSESSSPEYLEEIAKDLLARATMWAEQRSYGIGGGFDRVRLVGAAVSCGFEFGLTATEDGQLVPREDAGSLLAYLTEVAASRGGHIEGGFREYASDETDL